MIQCKNGKAQNHCFCIEYNKTAGEGAAVLKSFPQPLTATEEKYYVQKYTEGDLEAKHILIERNLRLVAHIVKYQPAGGNGRSSVYWDNRTYESCCYV